jgi:uncharacterized membrane protein YfcA
MSFPHIDLLYSASGLAVGFLVGLTGVGGGSLMTPLLVLLFGIHPATAVGTDLLYAAATKTAGTLVHGIKGSAGSPQAACRPPRSRSCCCTTTACTHPVRRA